MKKIWKRIVCFHNLYKLYILYILRAKVLLIIQLIQLIQVIQVLHRPDIFGRLEIGRVMLNTKNAQGVASIYEVKKTKISYADF